MKKEILSIKQSVIDKDYKMWEKKILSHFKPGEVSAREMLGKYAIKLNGYSQSRDFPIQNNTSQLSPYIARGELSVNEIFFLSKKEIRKKFNMNDYA